ncbi:MAG: ABC transporter ATP-binding protein/permease [Alphaproteobacteria bacterium]|nr:ABC transporter ATP-binding protein/permease [Alphaproteobacteria bacterium]
MSARLPTALAPPRQTRRWFVRKYVMPYWKLLIPSAVLMVLSSGAGVMVVHAIEGVLDRLLTAGLSPSGIGILAYFFAAGIGAALAQAGYGLLLPYLLQKLATDLKNDLFAHIVRLDYGFFISENPGRVLSYIVNDAEQIQHMFRSAVLGVARNATLAAGLIAFMFWKDWLLSLVVIALSPLVFHLVRRLARRARHYAGLAQEERAELLRHLEEVVIGIRSVKAAVEEQREVGRVHRRLTELRRAIFRMDRLNALAGPLLESCALIGVTAGFAYGAYRVQQGSASTGEITAFFIALIATNQPLRQLSRNYLSMQNGLAALQRVYGLFLVSPQVREAPDAKDLRIPNVADDNRDSNGGAVNVPVGVKDDDRDDNEGAVNVSVNVKDDKRGAVNVSGDDDRDDKNGAVNVAVDVNGGAVNVPAGVNGVAVEFKNVSFSYSGDSRFALHDVSFNIPAGSTIAFVGPSGAGKSTLFNILLRFWDPGHGEVRLADQNIRGLTFKSLRGTIALVSQEAEFFDDTVKNNLLYGLEKTPPQHAVTAAAKDADIHNFISSLPDGYNTLIGARGVKLSGGQRQRLALARALLREARLLLLDEATSSLDAESESFVHNTMKNRGGKQTVLLIAHRLSTVRHADRIFVIEGGHLSESGSHDELMARGGRYARLVRTQMRVGNPFAARTTAAEEDIRDRQNP